MGSCARSLKPIAQAIGREVVEDDVPFEAVARRSSGGLSSGGGSIMVAIASEARDLGLHVGLAQAVWS
jgi:hypothetical protein